jgi:hypothetical protein
MEIEGVVGIGFGSIMVSFFVSSLERHARQAALALGTSAMQARSALRVTISRLATLHLLYWCVLRTTDVSNM